MTHQPSSTEIASALDKIEQRLSESGVGEMGLIDTIHAVAAMVREARASSIGSTAQATATWQPIKTAPRDGTAVMLGFWHRGRFAQYQAFYGELGWMENSRAYHSKQFQAWFELWHPLPGAPSPVPSSPGITA